MRYKDWQQKLDASEKKLLPLIIISLLCVQILATARIPAVIGTDLPLWILIFDAVLLAATAGLLVWVNSADIPSALAHPITAAAYAMGGISAIASMVVQQDPLPFYFAMVVLAGSFCFLSQRYLLSSIAIITLLWVPAAVLTLTLAQIISTLLVTAVAAALSLAIMRHRILNMIKVYELETRVITLESILPMCASCKKTRDGTGKWQSIEEYIEDNQEGTQISHGSCPGCTEEIYGDLLKDREIVCQSA